MSTPEPVTPPSRLQICADQILADAEFPALSRQIQDILDVLKDEEAPATRLAKVVMQDYGLTLKVLRLANSYQYNRSTTPIESVSHAIVLLGVHTVRALAGTLLLFEHYSKRTPEMKQLLLLSMLTAHHARATCELLKIDRAEEAYLCGMFRNLGEVLVASHFGGDYRRIVADEGVEGRTMAQSCFRAMHFHFDDLAAEVARHWQLPLVIFQGTGPNERPSTEMQALLAFSHDLTALLYRRESPDPRTRLHLLMLRYSGWLALTKDRMGEIVDLAIQRTSEMFKSLNMSLDELKLRKRIDDTFDRGGESANVAPASPAATVPPKGALPPTSDGASPPAAEPRRPAAVPAAATPVGATPDRRAKSPFDAELDELEQLLAQFQPHMLAEVIDQGLRAIFVTDRVDRVLFGQVSADRKEISARSAVGEDASVLVKQFKFPLSLRGGPVAHALMRQQDMVVKRDAKPSAGEMHTLDTLGVHAMGIYPVSIDRDAIGCVYLDTLGAEREWTGAFETAVKRVRDHLARAHTMAARLGGRVWTAEAKRQIVARLVRGEDVGLVSRETRVPARELEQWRRELIDAGPPY
ncbi:MAG: HDOD domain-containing protein [Vicinamibacterales bacterium]